MPENLAEDMEVHRQGEEEDNLYLHYFEYILEDNGWAYPSSEREAIRLYQYKIEIQNSINLSTLVFRT